MTKEALKLALEALEQIKQETFHPAKVFAHNHAITAIREALAQPEHPCVACEGNPKGNNNPCAVCGLAQPEQEVDWEKLYRLEVKKKEALAAKYERDIKPLTKIVPMAQLKQEPVATVVSESGNQEVTMSWWHEPALPVGTKLYTTPPHRKPLTPEQRQYVVKMWRGGNWTAGDIIDAVEAAHGIKE